MAWREREILERAVHTIAEQTAKADFIHEEIAIGHDRPSLHAKMLRLELLRVTADASNVNSGRFSTRGNRLAAEGSVLSAYRRRRESRSMDRIERVWARR